jgi:lysophospholipase L1-like esterase
MKKIKLDKKEKIYVVIIALLLALTVGLSALIFNADQIKASLYAKEYYENKVKTFKIENESCKKGQIVFIGDSITDLYPLGDYYLDLNLECYNRGISGDSTNGVINRLDVSLLDLEPSVVVLMIGTNDINAGTPKRKILENYKIILDEIKNNQPTVELYFVSVIPQNKDLESYTNIKVDKTNQTIIETNAEIEKLCAEYGHTFIDLHSCLLDENGYLKKECSDDGIHLNSVGFEIWTSLLKPYLEK